MLGATKELRDSKQNLLSILRRGGREIVFSDRFLFVLRLFIRIAIKIIRGLSVTGFVMECYPLSSHWVPAFALKRRGRQKGYVALRLWRGGLPSLTHLEGDFWMSS